MSIGRDDHPTDPAWWFERELELELGFERDLELGLEGLESDRSAEPA